VASCLACGAPAQPDIDYCLECDIELAVSFDEAREYHELAAEMAGDSPNTTDSRCRDSRQHTFTF
jgi:hypothetical protein